MITFAERDHNYNIESSRVLFFDGVRVRAWSEIDEKYSDKTTTTIREIQTRDLKFGGCLGSKADVI